MMMGMVIIVAMGTVASGYASFLIRERKKKSKHMQVCFWFLDSFSILRLWIFKNAAFLANFCFCIFWNVLAAIRVDFLAQFFRILLLERVIKTLLQLMSGLPSWMYWATAYVWDVVFFLVTAAIFVLIFKLFKFRVSLAASLFQRPVSVTFMMIGKNKRVFYTFCRILDEWKDILKWDFASLLGKSLLLQSASFWLRRLRTFFDTTLILLFLLLQAGRNPFWRLRFSASLKFVGDVNIPWLCPINKFLSLLIFPWHVFFQNIMSVFWQEYTDSAGAGLTLFLTMVMFGWCVIPFVYTFSFAFNSAPKGYLIILIYNIISGKFEEPLLKVQIEHCSGFCIEDHSPSSCSLALLLCNFSFGVYSFEE